MSFDELLVQRIREIVREEVAAINGQVKRLTPEDLAERWHTDTSAITRLVQSGQLRAIQLSERKRVFAIEEVLRFEDAGGIARLDVAA